MIGYEWVGDWGRVENGLLHAKGKKGERKTQEEGGEGRGEAE